MQLNESMGQFDGIGLGGEKLLSNGFKLN